MSDATFNINSSELVSLTDKLERLHRSALPVAVRSTLNDIAFLSKRVHLRPAFDKQFTVRKPTFISSHSGVNKCKNTFNISEMISEMGIIKGKSPSGDMLQLQEFGGGVSPRTNIPLDPARVSQSSKKPVSRRYYLQNIKGKKRVRQTSSQAWIKAAFKAGKKGFVLFNKVLYEIRALRKSSRDHVFIKASPVYSIDPSRSIRLEKAPFISVAGMNASKDISAAYAKNAKRQIQKILMR